MTSLVGRLVGFLEWAATEFALHVCPLATTPDDLSWWWLWSGLWNENWQKKQKYSVNICPSANCPSQIPHDLTWAAAVGSQQLTAWDDIAIWDYTVPRVAWLCISWKSVWRTCHWSYQLQFCPSKAPIYSLLSCQQVRLPTYSGFFPPASACFVYISLAVRKGQMLQISRSVCNEKSTFWRCFQNMRMVSPGVKNFLLLHKFKFQPTLLGYLTGQC
jgi:hypothetical protein